MKKVYFLIAVIFLILNSCCTIGVPIIMSKKANKKKITHSQVMSKYQTKIDVIRAFGAPTKKEVLEGVEIWYYDLGTTTNTYSYGNANTSIRGNTNTAINVNSNNIRGNTNTAINGNTNAISNSRTFNSISYVEMQFQNDRVVNWRTKGVNYGEKTNSIGKYILLGFLGDILLGALLGAIN